MPDEPKFLFDDAALIRALRENFTTFRVFYDEVRPQIPFPLEWRRTPGMWGAGGFSQEVNARGQITRGLIELQDTDPGALTAYIVAHEMLHALHAEHGWAVHLGYSTPVLRTVANALGSLVEDPPVTIALRTFGFDVRKENQANFEVAKRYWRAPARKESPLIEALRYMTLALNAEVSSVPRTKIVEARSLIWLRSKPTIALIQKMEAVYQQHFPAWRAGPLAAPLARALIGALGLKHIWVRQ